MEHYILEAALEGLEAQRIRIDAQIEQVHRLLTGRTHTHIQGGSRTAAPKRTMSAAGRARIVAAQKARWAKVHAEQKAGEKPKRAAKPRLKVVAAAG
jgi:hypothetical protein